MRIVERFSAGVFAGLAANVLAVCRPALGSSTTANRQRRPSEGDPQSAARGTPAEKRSLARNALARNRHRTEKLLCVFAFAAVAGLSSCGSTDPVGCDFRETEGSGQEDRCQERRNLQAPPFGAACEALEGTVVEGGCPSEGIVAGCDLGNDVVDFYYAPLTRDDVISECDGEGTVVDAP